MNLVDDVDASVPDCTMYHDLQHGSISSNTLLHCLNFGLLCEKNNLVEHAAAQTYYIYILYMYIF